MSCRSILGAGKSFKCLQKSLGSKSHFTSCRYLSSRYINGSEKYLQQSIVPTYHFQPSLPRLPVPKLEDTCRRYLDAQKVILNPEEYEHTKKLVEAFHKNEAPSLQEQLVYQDKQNKHTSYITEPWSDMYLKDRRSVVLNHNPFMTFNEDPNPESNHQLVRAANFIISGMKFKNSLDDEILNPEVFHLNSKKSDTDWFKRVIRFVPSNLSWYCAYLVKAFPLDMSQFTRLFGTARIPQNVKDKLVTYEDSRHIMVIHNGNYYVFNVIDETGTISSPEEILAHLKAITSDTSVAKHSVGTLTFEDRDNWASSRRELECIAANVEPLKLIDSALFVLCLDKETPENPDDVTRIFLHGDGSNRWFDKSFQLTVCENAYSGLHFEHSWGDGVAVLRFFNEVFKDTVENPSCSIAQLDSVDTTSTNVRKLEFTLTASLEKQVTAAKEKFNKVVNTLDMSILQMFSYGKVYLKQRKLSPDAIMQLSFQMAYYRQHGSFVGSYESCSTSAFKHGRTETIRPATLATVACSEAFDRNHKAGVDEMSSLIKRASVYHAKLTREAAMGQGFDRHLFALRCLAEGSGKIPKIFQDPSFTRLNHMIISTSTLDSPAIMMGGFAPVVSDGYGIGYSPRKDSMNCNVLSYGAHVDVHGFRDCMRSSLEDIFEVLEGRNFKNKSA